MCSNVWNFFSNVKEAAKKVRLNSCRTDLQNRLLIRLKLNFDTMLAYKLSFLEKDILPLCFIQNFFSNVKQALKEVSLNPCRTDVSYYCNWLLMESLLNVDRILRFFNCYLLCKIFLIYCHIKNFFENIKRALKQVRVTLCTSDILHHSTRHLVGLNSKFDE